MVRYEKEVFLQVPVCLLYNDKQWESCLLHHSWLTNPPEGGLCWLLSVKSEVPGIRMRPLFQAVSKVKMFNKILEFTSLLFPLWVPKMFTFPHSSDLILKCLTSCGCCLLVLSGLMFHVNTCCDFLPVEGSMRWRSQKLQLNLVPVTELLSWPQVLSWLGFMSWFICLFVSVVMEVHLTLSLINVTKQFQ